MAKHKKPYKTYYEKILLSFTAILLLPVFNLAWAGLYMVGKAVSGEWADMVYRLDTSEGQAADYNFLIAEEGLYTVEVDMSSSAASPKMKVTKEEFNPHIIGDEGGGFVYTAVLKAGSNNTFKFRWADGWWPSLIATWGERTECSIGGVYDLAYMPNDNYDWQFYLDEEAAGKDVVVHVDLEEMKMYVSDDPARIEEARGKQIRTWSDGKHVMIENVDGEYSVTGLNGESHSGVADGSGIVDVEVNCNGVYVVTANCLSKRVLVY